MKISYLIIFLFLISCKSSDNPIIIPVNAENINENFIIDSLVEKDEIIKLEFNENYFINEISKVEKNSYYFVLADFNSSKKIVIFDLLGKCKFKIDLNSTSFTDFVLTNDNTLYLWDAKYNYIQKYRIGNLLEKGEKYKIPFSIYSTYFAYINDYNFIFVNNIVPINGEINNKFLVYNFQSKKVKSAFGYSNIALSNFKKSKKQNSFHDLKNNILITETFNDSILSIDKKSIFSDVKYVINFKNNYKDHNFHNGTIESKLDFALKNKAFYYLDNSMMIDSENYLMFYAKNSGFSFFNIFNKKTNICTSYNTIFFNKYNINLPSSGNYNSQTNELFWCFKYNDIHNLNKSEFTNTKIKTDSSLLINNPIVVLAKLKK